MTTRKSWFRPRFDDPGRWPDWEPEPEELRQVQHALTSAADSAVKRMRALYGVSSKTFGAESLATSLAKKPASGHAAFALARAIVLMDYHAHRAAAPRMEPGGLTNSRNRQIWDRLRPHLVARLEDALTADADSSILWRAILSRIPETPIPTELIERSIARQLAGISPYASISVELDIGSQVRGGTRWIAKQTDLALAAIDQALADRKPCLVELIRAPSAAPHQAASVIVYAMESDQAGDHRIYFLDPEQEGGRSVLLMETVGERRWFTEPGSSTDRPPVKALRLWAIEPAKPPLFGLRRVLDRLLPWRLFWILKRRLVLAFRDPLAKARLAAKAPETDDYDRPASLDLGELSQSPRGRSVRRR